jgi:hypothetical protein
MPTFPLTFAIRVPHSHARNLQSGRGETWRGRHAHRGVDASLGLGLHSLQLSSRHQSFVAQSSVAVQLPAFAAQAPQSDLQRT